MNVIEVGGIGNEFETSSGCGSDGSDAQRTPGLRRISNRSLETNRLPHRLSGGNPGASNPRHLEVHLRKVILGPKKDFVPSLDLDGSKVSLVVAMGDIGFFGHTIHDHSPIEVGSKTETGSRHRLPRCGLIHPKHRFRTPERQIGDGFTTEFFGAGHEILAACFEFQRERSAGNITDRGWGDKRRLGARG